jgi:hypothetical protein
MKRRRLPRNVEDEPLAYLEERLVAVGAGRAIPHAGIPTRRATAR